MGTRTAELTEFGAWLATMHPDDIEAYLAALDPDDPQIDAIAAALELPEVAATIAHDPALDWRATPARMAVHFAGWDPYAYTLLLGEWFAGAYHGTRNPKQLWWLPSQYGKTSMLANWGPVWLLDHDPTLRIMYVSYDANKAVEECGKARDITRDHSADLRFGMRPDRRARGRWVTTEGGGLYGVGIDGGITGFPADVLLLDDLFKGWQTAHSPVVRDHVWNVYTSQCRLRVQSEHAMIIGAGTRWHEDDVAARMRRAQFTDRAADQWDVLRLAARAEEPSDNPELDPVYREPDPLGRAPGEILEGRRFSEREVAARAAGLGAYLANAVEQQRPTPEEGNELKRDWLRIVTDLPDRFDDLILSCDMKLKDKEAGDFFVAQVWGRVGRKAVLVDQLRGQWNQATCENAIALALARWPGVTRTYIENTGNGPEVMAALRERYPGYRLSDDIAETLGLGEGDPERQAVEAIRREGLGALIPVTPKGSKAVRLRAYMGRIESGDVEIFDRPYAAALLEEAVQFPRGTHDDQIDAMSQALAKLFTGAATLSVARGTLPETSRDTRTGTTMTVIPPARANPSTQAPQGNATTNRPGRVMIPRTVPRGR